MSSTRLHVLSQLILKLGQFCCAENFAAFSPVRLLIQKLYFASDEDFKTSFVHLSPDVISAGVVQIWKVRCPLLFLNHLQTVRVHALLSDTCCVRACAESPMQAYRWNGRSVRQQSVMISNKFWKHTSINSFNYCLQNIATEITLQWRHCRVKLALLFVEINAN